MIRTSLGDNIIWDTTRVSVEDGLLHRCSSQRFVEASLLRYIPPNYSFLDIGAHYGDTSLTLAIHAKKHGRSDIRFIAFEPNEEKCKFIDDMAKKNNELNIKTICVAVGDKEQYVINNNFNYILSGAHSFNSGSDGTIHMITLDSVAEMIEPVGFMHIDVEGWESKVLLGCDNILRNNSPIIIAEVWPNHVSKIRGYSHDPTSDIVCVMNKHKRFIRQRDIDDLEKNVVYMVPK